MQKFLFLFFVLHASIPSLLLGMDAQKIQKKRCCYGGVIACLQRNITTPLWFSWHKERLIKELGQAVAADNPQKVTEIIGYGINPNGYREWGTTRNKFLEPALKNGKSQAAKALLAAGSEPTWDELKSAFDLAALPDVQHLMLAKYLALHEHDLRAKNLALGLAMQKGTESQIDFVLKNGALLNTESVCHRWDESITPLVYAIRERPSIVPFLLEQGAQVTNKTIAQAIKIGDEKLFFVLVKRHPFIIKGLQAKTKKKRTFVDVLMLLFEEEKVKEHDDYFWIDAESKPFHKGLRDAPADMIRFLCNIGVDVNWQDGQGRTALFYVDEKEKVQALLACRARIDIQDRKGKTVAHVLSEKSAKDNKYYKVLKGLLVHPHLLRSKQVSEEAARAVFTSLCSLRRVCAALPLDLRIKILLYAFRDEYHNGHWGKFMRNIPACDIVCNVPLDVQLQLIESRELSPGCYGSILDKEKLIQANTDYHMDRLVKLLSIRDISLRAAFEYAPIGIKEKLKPVLFPYFIYTWRGKVEREYRFFFETGTLYTCRTKKNK